MTSMRPFLVGALALVTTACGPTLTLDPADGAWHERGLAYSITPTPDGKPFPAGWTLRWFTPVDGGYRRDAEVTGLDFELARRDDDGVLLIKTYYLPEEDRTKLPEVLVERWLERIVEHPKPKGDGRAYVHAIPPIEAKATASVGFRTIESTMLLGRTVAVDHRGPVAVPGGEATEITATLAPHDAAPDRRVYLMIARNERADRYVVVVYGNTTSMFEAGLPDATSLAHRLRF